jgi:dTDP-4-dehydrorhamnose 3,5-epimerase
MTITSTPIEGLLIFEPVVFEDQRGYFFETFHEKWFTDAGINCSFVQDNQSFSYYGVIRGLHYQLNPHAQCKLVRVVDGTILDVAVDLRRGSPSYGQAFSLELSAKNKKQLLIPKGFAHGFSVLSKEAMVCYKCDEFYDKDSEAGIVYSDPELTIDWKIPTGEALVSEKDLSLPLFRDCINNFNF